MLLQVVIKHTVLVMAPLPNSENPTSESASQLANFASRAYARARPPYNLNVPEDVVRVTRPKKLDVQQHLTIKIRARQQNSGR